jgi:rubrerythrin
MRCDGTRGVHPMPHETEMDDEGIEWTERCSDGTRAEWHVYRCPICGYVTEAT